MLAGLLDIEIEQGATFELVFIYQDELGNPIDLTGMTARMQLRRQYKSPEVLIELSNANGRIIFDPYAGKITLRIAATDTEGLTGSGVYDLELIDGSTVNRLLEGSFIICNEVTK